MSKKPTPEPLSTQLRRHIAGCGLGIRELVRRVEEAYGKNAKADPGQLSNFLKERRGLSLETIDQISAVLQLELVMHGPTEATIPTKRKSK